MREYVFRFDIPCEVRIPASEAPGQVSAMALARGKMELALPRVLARLQDQGIGVLGQPFVRPEVA